MKNYLKPYTACTTVESEGYLLSHTDQTQQPGGGHETIIPVVPTPNPNPPCPPNPSIGNPENGSKGNTGGTKSSAQGAYSFD